MNKFFAIGRLTADPEVRYAQDNLCIARYTLAMDRQTREGGADFARFTAFGKNGEFAEKYLKKGTKIAVEGRFTSGSYQDKDGNTVYTNEFVAERHEFCESKGEKTQDSDGFTDIPEGIDEELPFAKPQR